MLTLHVLLLQWHVSVGDVIDEFDPVVEVQARASSPLRAPRSRRPAITHAAQSADAKRLAIRQNGRDSAKYHDGGA